MERGSLARENIDYTGLDELLNFPTTGLKKGCVINKFCTDKAFGL